MNKEWLERQKQNFKNHKAKLMDYGNIKILDFKNPNSNEYRIRFLFEEDYCWLHITGNLGSLIACNYSNMTYEKFTDFVDSTDYFEQKIDCLERVIYYYDEEQARKDIKEYIYEHNLCDYVIEDEGVYCLPDEENINDFITDVLEDFSNRNGMGPKGIDKLMEMDEYIYEDIDSFGKKETGILDLYMLAFKLAQEDLKSSECKKENRNDCEKEEKDMFYIPNISGFVDFISYHTNNNKPIYFVNGHVTAGFCLNTRLDQKYNFFSDEVVGEINETICENMYMFDVAKTNKFYSCNDNMFSRDNSAKNIEGLLLTVKRQFGGK